MAAVRALAPEFVPVPVAVVLAVVLESEAAAVPASAQGQFGWHIQTALEC